jgi:NADH-quinone oxidoreductase subunit J
MELLSQVTFWFFVAMILISAGVVVFHNRIIYSAFALLFTFFGVAALYLFLSADFVAASQVLIYVGGILTLIIFGVFLTAKVQNLQITDSTHQRYIALVPVVIIALGIGGAMWVTQWGNFTVKSIPTTAILGRLLLTTYLVPFEAASILLLAALVGSMRLARYYREHQTGDTTDE